MDKLEIVLEKVMSSYVAKGFNGHSYFMKNDAERIMSIEANFVFDGERYIEISILARIVGNRIVIEDDKTNKPLVNALLQAGVPREQIVLAYAGEKAEETA
jgi:XisI protein